MINNKNIKYINKNIKYSINKYLPIKLKTLLYDYLLMASIITEVPNFCTEKDIEDIKLLDSFCSSMSIDIEKYISSSYDYINKYAAKGHKLPISYLLNEKVISFCSEKVHLNTGSSLICNEVLSNILFIESSIRNEIDKHGSYIQSLNDHLKQKKTSDYFLAYKKYCNFSYIKDIKVSNKISLLIEILEPIFIYFLSKNKLYNVETISSWNNSKIEDFSFCPILFRDRYLLKQLPENVLSNDATEDGKKVHKIIEEIFKKYNNLKSKNIDSIYDKFIKSKLYLEYAPKIEPHLQGIKDFFISEDPIKGIFKQYITDDVSILLEHKMTAEVNGVSFYGTADLILINNITKIAYIIDYKTSKLDPKWLPKNNEKYLKQISLYSELLKLNKPELKEVHGIIFYTRGLIYSYSSLNTNIINDRIDNINLIKTKFKINNVEANKRSCFLCRHPDCPSRTTASIWNSDGTRKVN